MARDVILTLKILSDTKNVTAGLKKVSGLVGGLALGSVIKDSVKLEAAFSRTMSTMQASTGATSAEMDELRGLAMKLGADTSFSANEAADAMLELGKAGISTKDIMEGAADGTLLLASAGGTDLVTAATIASNALNTFNLKGSDMASVAAALAGGANASSASVESLGQGLQQVGPAATNAGLSLQETVAALSAFDAAGVKGSDAGTSLKTMLSRLIPSTESAALAMESVGLFTEKTGSAFVNADGSFKSLAQISGLLHKSLSGLSEAQRSQALTSIFGSDASRAAAVLMKEGSVGIKEYIKATNDQEAAQKMADAAMSGTAGALERLGGSFETLKLAIGQAVAPVVQTVANLIADKLLPAVTGLISTFGSGDVNGLGKWGAMLSEIGDSLVKFADSAISAGKTVAPAVLTIVDAVRPLAEGALSAALTVLPPLIGVLGSALKVAAKAFAGTVAFVDDNSTAFKILGALIGTLFVPLLIQMAVRQAQATAALIANNIAAKASAIYMRAMTVATKAWAAAQWLAAGAAKAFALAQRLVNAAMAMNPIGLIVVALIALGAGLVLAYKKSETFRNIVNAAFNGVKTVVLAVVNWFRTWVPQAFAFVVSAVRVYVRIYRAVVVGAFNAVRAVVRTVMGALRSIISGGWAAIKNIVTTGAGAIVSAVRGIPGKIKAAGTLFLNAGKALMGKLVEGLKQVGKIGVDIGRSLFNGVIDGINKAIQGVNDFLPDKIGIKGLPDIDLPNNPIPQIPHLATGGITTGPTLAVVGDNPGGREAIIPLNRYPHLLDGGEQTIVVEVYLDGKVIDRRVERVVGRQARRIVAGAGAA